MNENRVVVADEKEMTIGHWGKAWQRFMTDNHPTEAAELQAADRWDELALEIDERLGTCESCSASSIQKQIPARQLSRKS